MSIAQPRPKCNQWRKNLWSCVPGLPHLCTGKGGGVVTGYSWLGSLLLLIVCLVSVSFWVWFHFYLAAQFTRYGSVGFSTVRFRTVFGSALCCAACCGSWRAEEQDGWWAGKVLLWRNFITIWVNYTHLSNWICMCPCVYCVRVCVCSLCMWQCVRAGLSFCNSLSVAQLSGLRMPYKAHGSHGSHVCGLFLSHCVFVVCFLPGREWVSVRLSKSVHACVCVCVDVCLNISYAPWFRIFFPFVILSYFRQPQRQLEISIKA